MSWDQWKYYPLTVASRRPSVINSVALTQPNAPSTALRILITDDVEAISEADIKKFCERYLSVINKKGEVVCPTEYPVNVFFTTNFDLAETLFQDKRAYEEFDAIIQDVIDDTLNTERGFDSLKVIQQGLLCPFPAIMVISRNGQITEEFRKKKINQLHFAIKKEMDAENRAREENLEIINFFNQAEKNHKTNQDPRASEYQRIIGHKTLTLIQEYLSYLDHPNFLSSIDDKLMPLLILGDTGTGKEAIARLIHATDRSNDPAYQNFHPLLIASIPSGCLEGELYGVDRINPHETKENNAKPIQGYIEKAAGGTLFIDEVGDIPEHVQGGLLRFLQEGNIRPVGAESGWKEVKDVRIVFATHKNLLDKNQTKMRDDFLYRIDGLTLKLPNLAEREDEHEILVDYFFNKSLQSKHGAKKRQYIHPNLREKIIQKCKCNAFKGNIRQLKAFTQRIVQVSGNEEEIGLIAYKRAIQFGLMGPDEN